jgi:hypothetical protein
MSKRVKPAAARKPPPSVAPAVHNAFVPAVARILHRVDFTEGNDGDSSVVEDATASTGTPSTTASTTRDASSSQPQGGGPLTSQELSELSFLCSTALAARSKSSSSSSSQHRRGGGGGRRTTNNDNDCVGEDGFAAVEVDQLLGLMDLLNRHVNSAVSVHLMDSAAAVVVGAQSPSAAAAALDRVRLKNQTKARGKRAGGVRARLHGVKTVANRIGLTLFIN